MSERKDDPVEMVPKSWWAFSCLLLLGILLSGCPKKTVRMPPLVGPTVKNPVNTLLEAFSEAGNFQSKASIRVEIVRDGKRMNLLLNGNVIFEKPDKLRVEGFLPFGMPVFDALYRNGEFFLFSPTERKAYTGEISDFEDLMERVGVQISTEKTQGFMIPNLIRIGIEERQTRVDLRLKDVSINSSLPEDAFRWSVPEGVEVMPLAELLKRAS